MVEPERFEDERGFFARAWSEQDFAARGLSGKFVEGNFSINRKRGTLRGMHYQDSPQTQAKLVHCTRGAIYDVVIDLRPASPTFKQWFGIELSQDNRVSLYAPGEFAHGYQTLEDDTEIYYLVSDFYAPAHARGVRWDDPAFGIEWPPARERVILDRDREYPDFIS